MSQAILPGQSSTPPTNVTIPTIPFTCLKGLHGNCMRHCWGTTTRGDKEPQTEKISNLKATQGPKAPAPHAATPPEATPERERCTRYGTMHPIRGTAPDQKRCIAYGSGVAPQRTRTNAELANRAAPGPIQPEHRTPGERWAAILRPVDSALPRAHPQDDIASHRTQIVVRFAPNTRFRRISPKWTAL